MSKRDTGASLQTYIEEGYVPEAVVNYLCLLGWSPKENREKLPIAEIIQLFDLPQILRHNARFDIDKLHWLDGEYLREMNDTRFRELGTAALAAPVTISINIPPNYVAAALATCKGKIKRFSELRPLCRLLFRGRNQNRPRPCRQRIHPRKQTPNQEAPRRLRPTGTLQRRRNRADPKATAKDLGVKAGVLVHPTRLACTGSAAGPSLYHLLEILGKKTVLERIDAAHSI